MSKKSRNILDKSTLRNKKIIGREEYSAGREVYLTKRLTLSHKVRDADSTKAIGIIGKIYNLLSEVKLILEQVKSTNRVLEREEFIDLTSNLKLVYNNIIFLKALDSDVANEISNFLFSKDEEETSNISHFKYDIDRVSAAHVLNIEFFYQSHIKHVNLQAPVHIQLLEEIYSEGRLFDKIRDAFISAGLGGDLELSGGAAGSASGAASSIEASNDLYYGMKYENLPQIVGALVSNKVNNYQYQVAFKGKENSLLQLLKFNINLAINIINDEHNNVNFFCLAVEAAGNCAKILKALGHNLFESYSYNIDYLIEVRNFLAHSINQFNLHEIRIEDERIVETLEIISKVLDDIPEANYTDTISQIFVRDIQEIDEEYITESRTKKSIKKEILTAELETQIIEQAIRDVEAETIERNIFSQEKAKKELGNRLVTLMLEKDADVYDALCEVISSPYFDPNYLITVSHPAYKISIKELKEVPLKSIKKFEKFINSFAANISSDSIDMQESKILSINTILYKAFQTEDLRYIHLIQDMLISNGVHIKYLESDDIAINPFLLTIANNTFAISREGSGILNHFGYQIRKYLPFFAKSLLKEYTNQIKEPTSKLSKFLKNKLETVLLDMKLFAIATDNLSFFISEVKPMDLNKNLKQMIKSVIFCQSMNIYNYIKSTYPNIYQLKYSENETGILAAIVESNNLELLKDYLDHGVDPNQIFAVNKTPILNYAIKERCTEIAKLLLSTSNININKADASGITPIYLAVYNGNTELLEILLSRPELDLKIKNNDGFDAFLVACQRASYEVIEKILETGRVDLNSFEKNKCTALYLACNRGDVRIVKKLLEYDVDVNLASNNGICPLFFASNRGYFEIVKLLIAKDGIKIDLPDNEGETPLMVACRSGYVDIMEALLEAGADCFKQSNFGYDAFSSAVVSDNPKVLQKLCSITGLDIRTIRKDSINLLEFAVSNNYNKIAKYLLENKIFDGNELGISGLKLIDIATIKLNGPNEEMIEYLKATGCGSSLISFHALELGAQLAQRRLEKSLENDFEEGGVKVEIIGEGDLSQKIDE